MRECLITPHMSNFGVKGCFRNNGPYPRTKEPNHGKRARYGWERKWSFRSHVPERGGKNGEDSDTTPYAGEKTENARGSTKYMGGKREEALGATSDMGKERTISARTPYKEAPCDVMQARAKPDRGPCQRSARCLSISRVTCSVVKPMVIWSTIWLRS